MTAAAHPQPEGKVCPQCGRTPPEVEYAQRGYRADGVRPLWHSWCRACRTTNNKAGHLCRNYSYRYPKTVRCECGQAYWAKNAYQKARGCPDCVKAISGVQQFVDAYIARDRQILDNDQVSRACSRGGVRRQVDEGFRRFFDKRKVQPPEVSDSVVNFDFEEVST